MDPLYIEAVVCELREAVLGAAVSKIHQPGADDLVLRLWNGRENLRLLISADPAASRLHLTEANLPNPAAPPRFCQLLRARLNRLLAVDRVAGERIVRLVFAGSGTSRWTLVAELLGTRSNLILLDGEERIVDALHRFEGEGRAVLPGRPYAPPAAPRRFDLSGVLPEIPSAGMRDWLLDNVTPMSPFVAADLAAAVAGGTTPGEALARFRSRWIDRDFRPCIGVWQGRRVLAAFSPETLVLEGLQPFASPSSAADIFYAESAGEAVFGGGREELERVVRKGLQRLGRRLRNIEAEKERSLGFERQRQLGDLLLTNLHRVKRGMAEVVLDDWYIDPPGPVTVALDPSLSPQENAAACFRRHRKGKRALEHADRRRAETLTEIEWLEGVLLDLEEAESADELQAVRHELAEGNLLKVRPGPTSRRTTPAQPTVIQASSPGGYILYWGRNNHSNDHVSRRLTEPDDLWFHAHNLPGCHLVLKRGGRGGEIPEADVLFAAAIAAAHSRGKEAAKVEVMVTEGRWVRKPKGARPGLVTVERYRTVVVRPQGTG